MHILIFNAGSSSLSYKVFHYRDSRNVEMVFKGKAHRVGVKGTEPSYIESQVKGKSAKVVRDIPDHKTAARLAADQVMESGIPVDAVGHRFVHGGEYFDRTAVLDRASLALIRKCLPLAPLHNPISFNVIQETRRAFKKIPHYVVIDSAFHSTIPEKAYRYPLPAKITERFRFRRFGFHGISYSYISDRLPKLLNVEPGKLNMIVCHLGTGGASVMAFQNGASIDTSMGFSPNSGLIMSTRSGDIDPEVILYLVQHQGLAPAEVEAMLNNKSGLKGIAGFSSDISDIITHLTDEQFTKRAHLALDMYIERLQSYIGSYIMALGGRVDALVFTDDIGAGNPLIRERVCATLSWAGIRVDTEKNSKATNNSAAFIQSAGSKVAVVSMPTDEELMICLEGGRILGRVK